MGIEIIGKLTQKNNGDFKLVDLENVDYDGTGKSAKQELEKKIEEAKNSSTPYDDTAIKADIQTLKTNEVNLVTDETSMEGIKDNEYPTLTTTDKTLIGSINEVNAQYKDIENIYAKKEDVGSPTQEQVDTWLNAHPEATTKIQDNSVTENKTTFCYIGLNKFNPNELQYGYLDNSKGEFHEEDGQYVSSGFIKVTTGDVVKIYEFGNGYPAVFVRMCEYNNNKEFIVYTDANNSAYTVKNDGYIRFYCNKNQVTAEGCKVAVTINYDMTKENYEPFGYETSLKVEYAKNSNYATNTKHAEISDSTLNFDGTIETKNLNFVKVGLNKFNPNEVEYGYLDNSNGEFCKEDGQYACSGFIKVSNGDVVSIWGINSGTGYALYNAEKTFVKFVSEAKFENINIDSDGYLRICFYKNSLSQTWSKYNSITINFETPNTDYYRKFEYIIDENKLLIDNEGYGKIISCLGDSITQQGTISNLNGWQLILKDKLALSRIVNCGVGGSCVSGATTDAMWQDTRINAIDERSDFIIFMGGTNDWLQNKDIGTIDSVDTNTFYGALNTIVEKLFTRCPNAKIIFAGTIFGKPSDSSLNNSYKDYSDAIKSIALKYNIKFIDTSNLMCINEFNYTNFYQNEEGNYIHPNTLGGKRLSDIFYNAILKN